MSKIHIKFATDELVAYINKNISLFTDKVRANKDNSWIYNDLPKPLFQEKDYLIDDFQLEINPDCKNKDIDKSNSMAIYNALKSLPRYVLCDNRFWLWLHLEKFYKETLSYMPINSKSTIKDHWLKEPGIRRGLFYGVLSRMFFRVERTIGPDKDTELSDWVLENPERFRNLSWRKYSNIKGLVRGIIKGEKLAVEEFGEEKTKVYKEIAIYISVLGGATLLDAYSEEDIALKTHDKMIELLSRE